MAGFVFRLESYLSVKEKMEEQRKLEYGKSLAKLEEERKIKESLIDEKNNNVVSFKNSILKGVNPSTLDNYNKYIDLIKKKIESQNVAIKKAEDAAEEKRVQLVEAMKERKMLETLKEKDKEAYLKEVLQKEQKVTDEIVSYQYNDKD